MWLRTPTTMKAVQDVLWPMPEMKRFPILLSLFFVILPGACTSVPTASCKAPEQQSYCAKGMDLVNEAERARQAQPVKEPMRTTEMEQARDPGPAKEMEQPKPRSPTAPRRAPPNRNLPPPQAARPAAPSASIMRGESIPQPAAPARPGAPSPAISCDAGGCWDSNANRYSGSAGGTYIDNSGRPCHRTGAWMQCF
jgi:hypothetical protein